MSYEITGKVIARFETVQVTEKFSKREFWIETEGQYPETYKMQFVNDKCQMANNLQKGEVVTIKFNITGKPFKTKNGENALYNNLTAYEIVGKNGPTKTAAPAKKTPQPAEDLPNTDLDDLPF